METHYFTHSALSLPILCLSTLSFGKASAKVPALFIFGDSTADVGTNNFLPEGQARADHPFYGIDFPNSTPTGRFSNSFNSADFLGSRSPPPFLFLLSKHLGIEKHAHKGVNFASGGAGLLDITGQLLQVVPLSEQIEQFVTVHNNLTALRGSKATGKLLSKSIFCISVGSNDIFGYFLSNSSIPKKQFFSTLLCQYEADVKALYRLGARKFGIISIPPTFQFHRGLLEPVNELAQDFYSALDDLLCRLFRASGDEVLTGNAYEMTINVIQNPHPFRKQPPLKLKNFNNVETVCCGVGRFNAELPCNATAKLCKTRNNFVFWDMFHPTQAAFQLTAVILHDGEARFVAPVNFRKLTEDC
ncbi:Triacylglycerol lipase [Bertholletia excelsa]